ICPVFLCFFHAPPHPLIYTLSLHDALPISSFSYILTIYVIRAFGMTLVNTPVMTNGMNDLPRELTPDGSSLNSMQNQVSGARDRSEEHTSELQSRFDLVCRLLLEKKNKRYT